MSGSRICKRGEQRILPCPRRHSALWPVGRALLRTPLVDSSLQHPQSTYHVRRNMQVDVQQIDSIHRMYATQVVSALFADVSCCVEPSELTIARCLVTVGCATCQWRSICHCKVLLPLVPHHCVHDR